MQWNLELLNFLTWTGVLTVVFVIARRVSGSAPGLTAVLAMFVIGGLGLWDSAMITVALILVSVASSS